MKLKRFYKEKCEYSMGLGFLIAVLLFAPVPLMIAAKNPKCPNPMVFLVSTTFFCFGVLLYIFFRILDKLYGDKEKATDDKE